MSFQTGIRSEASDAPLFVGNNAALLAHESVTLASGQSLPRGAVLGRITASGKYVLSVAAAIDGSEVPRALLVEEANALIGDKTVLAYTRGDFIEDALLFGAGHTANSLRDALRDLGIFLSKRQAY